MEIIINVIAAAFLIFVIGSIFYLRNQRKKLVKKLLDEQKRLK
ncbi:MAG TPA: hypothetical protein VIM31_03830 [Candidatus Microsaccharimonas sp.]|jgi:hypothetical protein